MPSFWFRQDGGRNPVAPPDIAAPIRGGLFLVPDNKVGEYIGSAHHSSISVYSWLTSWEDLEWRVSTDARPRSVAAYGKMAGIL